MCTTTSAGGVEIRNAGDTIDEVVATGVNVHLEYMDDGAVFLSIGDVRMNLWTKHGAHIRANVASDTKPYFEFGEFGSGTVLPPKQD